MASDPFCSSTQPDFIHVPSKDVQFEDGTSLRVESFWICRSPVTVQQMREFCRATGYRTTADLRGNGSTYEHNFCLSELSVGDIPYRAAMCVSFDDATAFCKWAKCRLPSEAEWMAASIIDSSVIDRRDFQGLTVAGRIAGLPCALQSEGPGLEWTGTMLGSDFSVARRGPRHVRFRDWRDLVSQHRFILARGECHLDLVFRVCRNSFVHHDC
jgi:hypothetical protein